MPVSAPVRGEKERNANPSRINIPQCTTLIINADPFLIYRSAMMPWTLNSESTEESKFN
jgi:hypothetical protein